jgi:hypothetical protein
LAPNDISTPAPAALPISELRELELLLLAHHPLVFLETAEEERAEALLNWLARSLRLPLFSWAPKQGLWRHGEAGPVYGTQPFEAALRHIIASNLEALYHFRYLPPLTDEPSVVAALAAVERRLRLHQGAVIVTGANLDVPPVLAPLVARIKLKPPSDEEYHACARGLLAEVRKRMPVSVELTSDQMLELLAHLRGLTLTEVRRTLTQAMVSDGSLGAHTLERISAAKQRPHVAADIECAGPVAMGFRQEHATALVEREGDGICKHRLRGEQVCLVSRRKLHPVDRLKCIIGGGIDHWCRQALVVAQLALGDGRAGVFSGSERRGNLKTDED